MPALLIQPKNVREVCTQIGQSIKKEIADSRFLAHQKSISWVLFRYCIEDATYFPFGGAVPLAKRLVETIMGPVSKPLGIMLHDHEARIPGEEIRIARFSSLYFQKIYKIYEKDISFMTIFATLKDIRICMAVIRISALQSR